MSKRRKMTTLNKVYAYLECLLAEQGQNANSCDWFELEHTPDLDLLRKAAAYVSHRHPAIQAASEFEGANRWTWTRNISAFPEVRFVRVNSLSPDRVDDSLSHNIWGEPLDHKLGPPWRLHVTQYNNKCILQSITSHIYTCGKSANLISVDLLNAYSTLASGNVLDDEVVEIIDRNSNVLFAPDWTWQQSVRSWFATMGEMLQEMLRRPVGLATNRTKAVARGKTRVEFVDFGPELWSHLRSFARKEGISRHPFYLAAWTEALLEFNQSHGVVQKGPIKIMDNFSLRPFAHQNPDQFYELCAPPYALLVPYVRSNVSQRKHIHNLIEQLKGGKILNELTRYNSYHKFISVVGKIFGSKLVISSVAKSPFILSNTGPIPPDILRPHPLNIQRYFSFPQLFPPGKIMLIITSSEDSLRAVFLWDEQAIDEQTMTKDLIPRLRIALERSTNFTEQASLAPSVVMSE